MGIKGFTAWFRKQFPSAYVPRLPQYDHVYIDVAPMLYLASKVRTEEAYFNKLFRSLDHALSLARPQKSVLLALDGPAPLAKLLLQRRRRRVTLRREARAEGEAGISLLGLTPGTPFMARVADGLAFYACQRLQQGAYQGVAFEVSGASVPGEGEMKMANRLRAPWPEAVAPGDSHLMIGGDSDLTLIAMLAEPPHAASEEAAEQPQQPMTLHVAAEPAHRFPEGQQNLATARGCFDVGRLDELLAGLPAAEDGKTTVAALKLDLAACVVMASGNDYLPPLRGLQPVKSGLKQLWASYLAVRASKRYSSRTLVKRNVKTGALAFDCGVLTKMLEKRGVQPPLSEAAAAAEDDNSHGQLLPADALEYLQGILWVLDMYLASDCPDYRFTYERESPSAAAIIDTAAANTTVRRKRLPQSPYPPPMRLRRTRGRAGMPLSPAATALAMLPGGELSDEHAPEALKPLLQPDSPLAKLYEVCDTCEALSSTAAAAQQALQYAMQAADAAGIDPRGIRRNRGPPAAAAAASRAAEAPSAGSAPSSSDSFGSSVLSDGGESGSEGGDGGSDSSAGSEADSSESSPAGEQTPVGDVEALVLAAKQAVRSAQSRKMQHMRADHPYEPFPVAELEAAIDTAKLEGPDKQLRFFGESHRFRHASWAALPPPQPPSRRCAPLRSRLTVARDGWARGGEPQLQQPGKAPKPRASSRKPPKKRQPAGAADGKGVAGNSAGSNGSNGSNGSGEAAAAHSDAEPDSDAAGSEAAVAAAATSSSSNSADRPDAAAAAFAGLQQRQHVLSALSRGHFPSGSAQLRGSAGGSPHSLGGFSSSLQARGFGSSSHSGIAWQPASFRHVPQAAVLAAAGRMQPFGAAIGRLLGCRHSSSSSRMHVQKLVWQTLERQPAWQRRPPGGGGARQLLALAACAQRWVQRPLLRL